VLQGCHFFLKLFLDLLRHALPNYKPWLKLPVRGAVISTGLAGPVAQQPVQVYEKQLLTLNSRSRRAGDF
jgi:hypothetical protein